MQPLCISAHCKLHQSAPPAPSQPHLHPVSPTCTLSAPPVLSLLVAGSLLQCLLPQDVVSRELLLANDRRHKGAGPQEDCFLPRVFPCDDWKPVQLELVSQGGQGFVSHLGRHHHNRWIAINTEKQATQLSTQRNRQTYSYQHRETGNTAINTEKLATYSYQHRETGNTAINATYSYQHRETGDTAFNTEKLATHSYQHRETGNTAINTEKLATYSYQHRETGNI